MMTSNSLFVFEEPIAQRDSAGPESGSVLSSLAEKPVAALIEELAHLNPDHRASIERLLEEAAGAAPGEEKTAEPGLFFAIRHLPAMTSRLEGALAPETLGLAAESRIGPLLTTHGAPLWIDVFRIVRQLRFVRAPGGAPIFTLPINQFGFVAGGKKKGPVEFKLARGSIWFATNLFAAAPAGLYSGMRIKGGTLRFSSPPDLSSDEVVLPASLSCDIELELDPPKGGAKARNDLAAATFSPPRRLAVGIRASGATIKAIDKGKMGVYGANLVLTPDASPARYIAELNRLAIPMSADQTELTIGAVQSPLFEPQRKATIDAASLALPAAPIDPAQLGEASGVGSFLLELESGLGATWRNEARAVRLNKVELMLDADRLAASAATAPADGEPLRLQLGGGDAGTGELVRRSGSPVLFLSQSNGDEILAVSASADIRLKRPLDVAGQRLTAKLPNALVLVIDDGTTERLIVSGQTDKVGSTTAMAFAVTNAVLRSSPPVACLVGGELQGDTLSIGLAVSAFTLFGIRPSLPDPYAANYSSRAKERGERGGTLLCVLRFDAAGTRLDFILPPSLQLDGNRAAPITLPYPGSSPGFAAVAANVATFSRATDPFFTFERSANVILVDVSTAASRFGVALRPPVGFGRDNAVGSAPLKPFAIRELQLCADGRLVTLLTLPAVQWEPLRNIPNPAAPFPDEVRFLNSGVPTVVDVPTVQLVPVTPLDAYETILTNFAGQQPAPSAARFTLPFGMVASSRLTAPGPGGRGALVAEARPSSGDLKGAHQLRIDAADPTLPPEETPALPGSTVQLPVAVPTGSSLGISALDEFPVTSQSVTTIFNSDLGPGSPNALVPVTRIDLSGFGESLFSHWVNPLNAETQVSKAEFRVVNGRAGHEVVQVQSVMAPGAVPVVRTITFDRKGNAVFTRYDSGWIPVRDGEYHYSSGSPVVTHPGVVERFTRVTNIRETGGPVTANGQLFAPVYYDCDLIIDGAPAPVPARRQLGYVKLSIVDLDVATYAALIDQAGPMGGPIDVTIGIGGGPVRMRLRRIGIGVAGSEFAMAAWGSPIFPGGGEWSILTADDSAAAPILVPEDRGPVPGRNASARLWHSSFNGHAARLLPAAADRACRSHADHFDRAAGYRRSFGACHRRRAVPASG
jgi:hypothetical protein